MLKDMIQSDIENVFFNSMDFASEHELNGDTIMCVLDEGVQNQYGSQALLNEYSTIGKRKTSMFVKTCDVTNANRLKVSATAILDGRQYIVDDIHENDGVTEVILIQNFGI